MEFRPPGSHILTLESPIQVTITTFTFPSPPPLVIQMDDGITESYQRSKMVSQNHIKDQRYY